MTESFKGILDNLIKDEYKVEEKQKNIKNNKYVLNKINEIGSKELMTTNDKIKNLNENLNLILNNINKLINDKNEKFDFKKYMEDKFKEEIDKINNNYNYNFTNNIEKILKNINFIKKKEEDYDIEKIELLKYFKDNNNFNLFEFVRNNNLKLFNELRKKKLSEMLKEISKDVKNNNINDINILDNKINIVKDILSNNQSIIKEHNKYINELEAGIDLSKQYNNYSKQINDFKKNYLENYNDFISEIYVFDNKINNKWDDYKKHLILISNNYYKSDREKILNFINKIDEIYNENLKLPLSKIFSLIEKNLNYDNDEDIFTKLFINYIIHTDVYDKNKFRDGFSKPEFPINIINQYLSTKNLLNDLEYKLNAKDINDNINKLEIDDLNVKEIFENYNKNYLNEIKNKYIIETSNKLDKNYIKYDNLTDKVNKIVNFLDENYYYLFNPYFNFDPLVINGSNVSNKTLELTKDYINAELKDKLAMIIDKDENYIDNLMKKLEKFPKINKPDLLITEELNDILNLSEDSKFLDILKFNNPLLYEDIKNKQIENNKQKYNLINDDINNNIENIQKKYLENELLYNSLNSNLKNKINIDANEMINEIEKELIIDENNLNDFLEKREIKDDEHRKYLKNIHDIIKRKINLINNLNEMKNINLSFNNTNLLNEIENTINLVKGIDINKYKKIESLKWLVTNNKIYEKNILNEIKNNSDDYSNFLKEEIDRNPINPNNYNKEEEVLLNELKENNLEYYNNYLNKVEKIKDFDKALFNAHYLIMNDNPIEYENIKNDEDKIVEKIIYFINNNNNKFNEIISNNLDKQNNNIQKYIDDVIKHNLSIKNLTNNIQENEKLYEKINNKFDLLDEKLLTQNKNFNDQIKNILLSNTKNEELVLNYLDGLNNNINNNNKNYEQKISNLSNLINDRENEYMSRLEEVINSYNFIMDEINNKNILNTNVNNEKYEQLFNTINNVTNILNLKLKNKIDIHENFKQEKVDKIIKEVDENNEMKKRLKIAFSNKENLKKVFNYEIKQSITNEEDYFNKVYKQSEIKKALGLEPNDPDITFNQVKDYLPEQFYLDAAGTPEAIKQNKPVIWIDTKNYEEINKTPNISSKMKEKLLKLYFYYKDPKQRTMKKNELPREFLSDMNLLSNIPSENLIQKYTKYLRTGFL